MKKLIGFVSQSNPFTDRIAWSGTSYKMREAIENAGYEVKWIQVQPNKVLLFFLKVVFRIIFHTRDWAWSNAYRWLCAQSVNTDDIIHCDYLFFPGGAQITKYLKKRLCKMPPVIYVADACFRQMLNYYWYDIPRWIEHQADEQEKSATDNSTLVIKSSDWALNSVIHDYGCPKDKAFVLEFGANIDEKDIVEAEPYRGGELRILFSGTNWKRKGGDIAIDTVRKLNENGLNAKLFLVGLDADKIPTAYQNVDGVEYVGYLNKNNPQQYNKYIEIIRHCHCLLLPTHAECSAMVLCEAAAFGLPSFIYDTGGLANYVINGKNGYRLDSHSTADDFAKVMMRTIDNDEFEKHHRGALTLYAEKLNWTSWSQRLSELIESTPVTSLTVRQ